MFSSGHANVLKFFHCNEHREWNDDTMASVIQSLMEELSIANSIETDNYKVDVAAALFYRFFKTVAENKVLGN